MPELKSKAIASAESAGPQDLPNESDAMGRLDSKADAATWGSPERKRNHQAQRGPQMVDIILNQRSECLETMHPPVQRSKKLPLTLTRRARD